MKQTLVMKITLDPSDAVDVEIASKMIRSFGELLGQAGLPDLNAGPLTILDVTMDVTSE